MTTKKVLVGNVPIGGDSPVSIQSMTNTKTSDVDNTRRQISALEDAGCEIIRVSVPDEQSADALPAIKKYTRIPLVADIHFRADLAVRAIEAGVDKVRINPGNIGDRDKIATVVKAARRANIPIRVGVNAGSLSRRIRDMDAPPAEKLVASAIENIELLEEMGFTDIVVSVKSSGVMETVAAYRRLASLVDYPLHLGVTESGTLENGSLKSAVALGILLAENIGDTMRVSLAADPVYEIDVAKRILQAVEKRRFYPEVIACPTCARCEISVFKLAEALEAYTKRITKPIKIAVMGCVVNGPGEAADADIGLAAGKGKGVIFVHGRPVKTVAEADFLTELIKEIDKY
jgi:(E)-4-hydroxy-3-methylbut-2-enyl-diphosphate synthase